MSLSKTNSDLTLHRTNSASGEGATGSDAKQEEPEEPEGVLLFKPSASNVGDEGQSELVLGGGEQDSDDDYDDL